MSTLPQPHLYTFLFMTDICSAVYDMRWTSISKRVCSLIRINILQLSQKRESLTFILLHFQKIKTILMVFKYSDFFFSICIHTSQLSPKFVQFCSWILTYNLIWNVSLVLFLKNSIRICIKHQGYMCLLLKYVYDHAFTISSISRARFISKYTLVV